jgi:hypothetical protein
MPVFKTTDEILNNLWKISNQVEDLPARHEWLKSKNIEFSDITMWEEIYFQPGNIGIYAAWSPYAELYVITYNLINCIDVFSGENAGVNVYRKANSLGIKLPINTVWVAPNDPALQDQQLTPL